jgi:hypothetical protein
MSFVVSHDPKPMIYGANCRSPERIPVNGLFPDSSAGGFDSTFGNQVIFYSISLQPQLGTRAFVDPTDMFIAGECSTGEDRWL